MCSFKEMHYSLTSHQLYFLVPLSSFLAHLLTLSHHRIARTHNANKEHMHVHICTLTHMAEKDGGGGGFLKTSLNARART